MIVLVGGEKGGTGKTTISTNIASLRSHAGKDVLLVDTDQQSWLHIGVEQGMRIKLLHVYLVSNTLVKDLQIKSRIWLVDTMTSS